MENNWKNEFEHYLPFLGHRNWVLVVDKAFPMQSSPAMKILNSNEQLTDVLPYVLGQIAALPHVRPVVYVDKELDYLDDSFCPGISSLRSKLLATLEKHASGCIASVLHETVFKKLDEAGSLFNVVVIKTESLLPYTSVFMQLDCGYWSEAQEKELRDRMK